MCVSCFCSFLFASLFVCLFVCYLFICKAKEKSLQFDILFIYLFSYLHKQSCVHIIIYTVIQAHIHVSLSTTPNMEQDQITLEEARLLQTQVLENETDEFDVFKNVGQGLQGHYKDIMIQYWQELINELENINENPNDVAIENDNEPNRDKEGSTNKEKDEFKSHFLPFARIRKVMKTDEDVKMISAEVPILFAKACEIFITELTMRAWCISEQNKRRTLQRQDVVQALKQSDMFDFLIDVVPRD